MHEVVSESITFPGKKARLFLKRIQHMDEPGLMRTFRYFFIIEGIFLLCQPDVWTFGTNILKEHEHFSHTSSGSADYSVLPGFGIQPHPTRAMVFLEIIKFFVIHRSGMAH